MKHELDELTTKTNNELDRIKESTKEMYERENRYISLPSVPPLPLYLIIWTIKK